MLFDNVSLTQTTGSVLKETHYYPYRYNGKELNHEEFNDNTGLELYDYGFREYDPQIGRLIEEDPLTDALSMLSPYQYAADEPVGHIDVNGLVELPVLTVTATAVHRSLPSIAARFVVNEIGKVGKIAGFTSLAAHGAQIAGTVINGLGVTKSVGAITSPIFDMTGNFLGTDDQGFRGEILFMNRSLYQIISGFGTSTISHKTALTFGTTVEGMPFTQQSAIAIGNAFTNIDSKVNILGFKMSDLSNNAISTYGAIGFYDKDHNYQVKAIGYNNNGEGLSWTDLSEAPAFTSKANKTITYNLNNEFRPMINTVENVQNLFVHEASGHFVHGYDANKGLHYKAYQLQISHPTFKATTPYFQQQILEAYKNIMEGKWQ